MNKYLEKVATTISMWQHEETGRTAWLPEGKTPGSGWFKTKVKKHIFRKK